MLQKGGAQAVEALRREKEGQSVLRDDELEDAAPAPQPQAKRKSRAKPKDSGVTAQLKLVQQAIGPV